VGCVFGDAGLGNGDRQNGGYTLTTESGGVSETRTKSFSAAEEVKMDEFLETLGALKLGSYNLKNLYLLNDLSGIIQKTNEVKKNVLSSKTESKTNINSTALSNTTVWRTNNDGKYEGTNGFASPEEIESGDTLGGKFERKSQHPERK
jgi:hypothetical protein